MEHSVKRSGSLAPTLQQLSLSDPDQVASGCAPSPAASRCAAADREASARQDDEAPWLSALRTGLVGPDTLFDGPMHHMWRDNIIPRLDFEARWRLACSHPAFFRLILRELDGLAQTCALAKQSLPRFSPSQRVDVVSAQIQRHFSQRQRLRQAKPTGESQFFFKHEVVGLALLNPHARGKRRGEVPTWRLMAGLTYRKERWPCQVYFRVFARTLGCEGRRHVALPWDGKPAFKKFTEEEEPATEWPENNSCPRCAFAKDGSWKMFNHPPYPAAPPSYGSWPSVEALSWSGAHVNTRYPEAPMLYHTAPSDPPAWLFAQSDIDSALTGVALSDHTSFMATHWADGSVRLYDVLSAKTYALRYTWRLSSPVREMALGPDLPRGIALLATATNNGHLSCHRIGDGKKNFDRRMPDHVTCMALAPDGATLAVGLFNHSLHLVDSQSGLTLHTYKTKTPPSAVHFAEDGSALCFGTTGGQVRLFTYLGGEDC